MNLQKNLRQDWKNATEPQSHRATEPQRLERSLRSERSRFAFRETERARRGRACDLLAASRVGHRGKTRAPSKLRNIHGGPQEPNELDELFSLCSRPNLAATPPPSWHERTSPRASSFSVALCLCGLFFQFLRTILGIHQVRVTLRLRVFALIFCGGIHAL